jgi:hypothetical protein
MNLRIIHSEGEFIIRIVNSTPGFKAMLFKTPAAAPEVVFSGEGKQDPYDLCLNWASANIHGEFLIEAAQA